MASKLTRKRYKYLSDAYTLVFDLGLNDPAIDEYMMNACLWEHSNSVSSPQGENPKVVMPYNANAAGQLIRGESNRTSHILEQGMEDINYTMRRLSPDSIISTIKNSRLR